MITIAIQEYNHVAEFMMICNFDHNFFLIKFTSILNLLGKYLYIVQNVKGVFWK